MSEVITTNDTTNRVDESEKSVVDFYNQIEAEFNAIREKHRQQLGADDIAYITGLRRKSRMFELAGRGLLWISNGPISFVSGVGLIWLHRNLEAIEIGHNVLHGQYDYFPEIPQFHSRNFKWKAPVDEEAWRREHNCLHHVYTNVYEKDPDLNHGFLRTNDRMPWNKSNLYQVPLYLLAVYPTMLYQFNGQNLGFAQEHREQAWPTGNQGYAPVHEVHTDLAEREKRRQRSVWRVWAKEYVAFPVLAGVTGYSALKVAAGNFMADTFNNYWIALTIQATHLTEPLQSEEAINHKGHWYLSQLQSSVNFKGNRWQSVLWGHLNYQIEHHLFPDIPSHRYPEMAKEVKQVCAKYGIDYKLNPNWRTAIRKYLGVLVKHSFPNKKGAKHA